MSDNSRASDADCKFEIKNVDHWQTFPKEIPWSIIGNKNLVCHAMTYPFVPCQGYNGLEKKTIISVKYVGNLLDSSFPALSDRIILRFPAAPLMRTRSNNTAKSTLYFECTIFFRLGVIITICVFSLTKAFLEELWHILLALPFIVYQCHVNQWSLTSCHDAIQLQIQYSDH